MIHDIDVSAALLGALTSILNPSIYKTGKASILKMAENPSLVAKSQGLADLLRHWTSPFLAMSLMSNRNTPLHRDNGGAYASMDLLVSVGNYQNGWLQVPGVGFNLNYYSGTVVCLAGRVVRHGATVEGERVCWAQYNREDVAGLFGESEFDWVFLNNVN